MLFFSKYRPKYGLISQNTMTIEFNICESLNYFINNVSLIMLSTLLETIAIKFVFSPRLIQFKTNSHTQTYPVLAGNLCLLLASIIFYVSWQYEIYAKNLFFPRKVCIINMKSVIWSCDSQHFTLRYTIATIFTIFFFTNFIINHKIYLSNP